MQALAWFAAAIGALLMVSIASHWEKTATVRLPSANVEYVCNTAMLDDAVGSHDWTSTHGCSDAPGTGLLKQIQALPGDLLDEMFGPRNVGPNLQAGASQR